VPSLLITEKKKSTFGQNGLSPIAVNLGAMRNAERGKKPWAPETPTFFINQPTHVKCAVTLYCNFEQLALPLSLELLDALVVLAGDKRERDDTRDVHLRAEDVHVEAELDADGLDVLETLLVVGTGATDPDLDLVLDELGSNLTESADDTLESGSDLFGFVSE
jgi:hypothetical protein